MTLLEEIHTLIQGSHSISNDKKAELMSFVDQATDIQLLEIKPMLEEIAKAELAESKARLQIASALLQEYKSNQSKQRQAAEAASQAADEKTADQLLSKL